MPRLTAWVAVPELVGGDMAEADGGCGAGDGAVDPGLGDGPAAVVEHWLAGPGSALLVPLVEQGADPRVQRELAVGATSRPGQ